MPHSKPKIIIDLKEYEEFKLLDDHRKRLDILIRILVYSNQDRIDAISQYLAKDKLGIRIDKEKGLYSIEPI